MNSFMGNGLGYHDDDYFVPDDFSFKVRHDVMPVLDTCRAVIVNIDAVLDKANDSRDRRRGNLVRAFGYRGVIVLSVSFVDVKGTRDSWSILIDTLSGRKLLSISDQAVLDRGSDSCARAILYRGQCIRTKVDWLNRHLELVCFYGRVRLGLGRKGWALVLDGLSRKQFCVQHANAMVDAASVLRDGVGVS